jgi:hypothetical protein
MSEAIKQGQNAGDHSTNLQAKTIELHHHGITVTEARQIALDVFKANALELAGTARELFEARGREFIDRYLEELRRRKPEELGALCDPDMQYTLFEAQLGYARSGDKDLSDVLLDMLIDRAAERQRTLKQVVLSECISVVSRLTLEQLDMLSLIFFLRYAKHSAILTIGQFDDMFSHYILPFAPSVVTRPAPYQHLETLGCALEHSQYLLGDILRDSYPAIFCRGLTKEQVLAWDPEADGLIGTYLVPCHHDGARLQLANADEISWSDNSILGLRLRTLLNMQKQYMMDNAEIYRYLFSKSPSAESLLENWDNSLISHLRLTTRGIAIGPANVRRKTGQTFDLSEWIS